MRLFASLCWVFFALPLSGQARSPDTSAPRVERRQNAWVSGGIGVGTGGLGVIGSAWYSNNHLVVGARKTLASEFYGRDVHDTAWLLGVRNLAERSLFLIVAGPAKVGGLHHRHENDPSFFVPAIERGMAVSAEYVFTFRTRGIGSDLFAAWSKNRSMAGLTFSIQVGWLGN